ncbi:hypothetical protein ACLKA6_003094 [Drosophila palustris]
MAAGAIWQISDVYTASDHVAILTTIGDHSRPAGNGVPRMQAYRVEQLNSQLFSAALQSVATEGSAEDRAHQITSILANACDSSMPRRKPYMRHHEPTFWWNERIANARQACLRARRRYQRARGRPDYTARQEEYRVARRQLKREIRSSKRECFLKLCDSAEHDPWGNAYKIVVKAVYAGRQHAPTNASELKQIVETLFPAIASQQLSQALVSVEDAQHVVFQCPRFRNLRQSLEEALGGPITEANLVSRMLESIQNWEAISDTSVPVKHCLCGSSMGIWCHL